MASSKNRFFPAYNVMIKPNGAKCNLKCEYCYYLAKEKYYPGSTFKMEESTLRKFTREYLNSQDAEEIVVGWQGGEPTLSGLDFFRKAIQFQRQYAKSGIKILNTLQTNGTLLTDEWAQFLKENNFLVGISIDGPPDIHNTYRHTKKGGASFDQVIRGLKLLQKYKVDYNILTTVHAANVTHPLEVYRYFRDTLKAEFIQYIPIIEIENAEEVLQYFKGQKSMTEPKITKRSVNSKAYGEFLFQIFLEWVHHDVGKIFVQLFDTVLSAWMRYPPTLCCFSPICGNALILEHNGDVYSCDHFVFPTFKLGNIKSHSLVQMVNSTEQVHFGKNKTVLPQRCLQCKFQQLCYGECPRNRILKSSQGEYGLNYLCEGYTFFFNESASYFEKMIKLLQEGHLAADIMKQLK